MKKIELNGIGVVSITPIKFKDQEGETVDSDGQPLKYVMSGKGTSSYQRVDGTVCDRSLVCKKFLIDGETIIMPKLKPTTKVENDDINTLEAEGHNTEQKAIERGLYVADVSGSLKQKLDKGSVYEFPLVTGAGHKLWRGVLKRYIADGIDCYMLFAVRGNMDNIIKSFLSDPIEIEIPIDDGQSKSIRKMFKTLM